MRPGHYYLLNNYNPGYNIDGSLNTRPSPFLRSTICLDDRRRSPAHGISWGYYGEGYDNGHPGPRTTAGSAIRCSTRPRS